MKTSHHPTVTPAARFLALAALAALTAQASYADSIGIDFSTTRTVFANTGPIAVAPGDTAGVVGQQNWNVIQTSSGSSLSGNTANVTGPTSGVLVDSSGSASGAQISYNFGSNSQGIQLFAPTNADNKLFANYIEGGYGAYNFSTNTFGPAPTMSVAVSNLSYSTYDVYVYFSDIFSSTASSTIGGTTYYYTANNFSPVLGSPYIQATGTTAGTATAGATYALFQGVTGSSFNLDINLVSGNRATIAAMQIVQSSSAVPDTSATLVLLGLGFAGLVSVRRKFAR
ncbi:MAG: VPDSG-CTERM sorting domain-containing protein [Verrucomicrobia bacterium]|nr:VPDSG-CTERM sorting domain-containing protein [Verrucomicrobiota bacterium]